MEDTYEENRESSLRNESMGQSSREGEAFEEIVGLNRKLDKELG